MSSCDDPTPAASDGTSSPRCIVPLIRRNGLFQEMAQGEVIPQCFLPSSESGTTLVPDPNVAFFLSTLPPIPETHAGTNDYYLGKPNMWLDTGLVSSTGKRIMVPGYYAAA